MLFITQVVVRYKNCQHKTNKRERYTQSENELWDLPHNADFSVDVLGTKVDFVIPVETDDDDGDDDADNSVSKPTEEHMAEVVGSINNCGTSTDDDKSCFDFYG